METLGTAETTVRAQSNIEYTKPADYDFEMSVTEANAQEMQHIKEAAAANGTFMKAPNGKAANLIDEFEEKAGPGLIAELWQRVNAATGFLLKTILDAGIIDKTRYDELKAPKH